MFRIGLLWCLSHWFLTFALVLWPITYLLKKKYPCNMTFLGAINLGKDWWEKVHVDNMIFTCAPSYLQLLVLQVKVQFLNISNFKGLPIYFDFWLICSYAISYCVLDTYLQYLLPTICTCIKPCYFSKLHQLLLSVQPQAS